MGSGFIVEKQGRYHDSAEIFVGWFQTLEEAIEVAEDQDVTSENVIRVVWVSVAEGQLIRPSEAMAALRTRGYLSARKDAGTAWGGDTGFGRLLPDGSTIGVDVIAPSGVDDSPCRVRLDFARRILNPECIRDVYCV